MILINGHLNYHAQYIAIIIRKISEILIGEDDDGYYGQNSDLGNILAVCFGILKKWKDGASLHMGDGQIWRL